MDKHPAYGDVPAVGKPNRSSAAARIAGGLPPGREAQYAPTPGRLAQWAKAGNVLCVRLDAIGDVLMTGPAMRALAARGARLTLLTSPAGATIAQLMPEISSTIAYEAPWIKASPARARATTDWEMIERLRARRFDAAAVFTVYSQSPLPAALMCLLAEVPLRLAHCRENPYALLTDWVPETEPAAHVRHEVRRQLDLVAAVGAHGLDEHLVLRVPEAAQRTVAARLAQAGIDRARAWTIVHAGSTARSRRYPPELLAAACRSLVRDHGVQLLFTGDGREAPLVDAVRQQLDNPCPSLAGHLDVAELAALVQAAPLLIAGNTGPVHIAAAVGTPVLDLYALTNPQHTPWSVPSVVLYHDVPCRWCYKSICPEGHHLCLRGVAPEAIVEGALALLREPHGVAGAPWKAPLRLDRASGG